MSSNIERSIIHVNRPLYLTADKRTYKFAGMKYGERLKLAFDRSGLTQIELAERVGMKQPSLSYLMDPKNNAKGSEYTVKLAHALGVSVEWLDDEVGDMIPVHIQKEMDPRIAHVVKVMESLPPYAVDAGVREIDSLAELISNMPRPNGSTG